MKEKIQNYYKRLVTIPQKWELVFWWILRISMIVAMADSAVGLGIVKDEPDIQQVLQTGANLCAMFIWEIGQLFSRKRWPRYCPTYIQNILSPLVWCASFGGAYLNWYYSINCWDIILHAVLGGFAVVMGYELVTCIQKRDKKYVHINIALLCALGVSFLGCTGWEIFEFTFDQIAGGDSQHPSIFSGVGFTERPDVVTAKMAEGKICIIVDGTPNAIIVPYIFIEHFHSLDDYLKRPYYATFIRLLKIASFLVSVFLPGLYVAVCTFHQEIIPESMIFGITGQESRTPFPIMLEAIFIHLVYEIVREAGLRMPKTVGHAISIVGALVIGESAVTAGIVSAPMIIVVGLTAVSSFVVSTLYEPVAVLRFAFIIIGGLSGLYGIMLSFAVVLINAASINPYGVPFTSPMSPTKLGAMRDFILRSDWRNLGKRQMLIDKMEK